MHPVGVLIVEGLALLILPAVILWLISAPRTYFLKLRCKKSFRRWWEKNGFEILAQESRRHWRGPFVWGPKEDYSVTRLEVRDRDGNTRTGFIRCGNHAAGLLGQHDVSVCWDAAAEEPDPSRRLLLWIGAPFLSFSSVVVAYTYWFAGPRFKPTLSLTTIAPILLASLVMIGITVMSVERKRGFPTLRKIVAVDGATFKRLFLLNSVACIGGVLFAAGVASIRYLDDHPRLPDQTAIPGSAMLVLGIGLVSFGTLRVASLLRRVDLPSS